MNYRCHLGNIHNLIRDALQPWGRRTLFLIGGLLVGAATVLMAMLADRAQHEFHYLLGISRYLPLVLTPLGLGLIVFLTLNVFPNSQGSGIPQVIAARGLPGQAGRLSPDIRSLSRCYAGSASRSRVCFPAMSGWLRAEDLEI